MTAASSRIGVKGRFICKLLCNLSNRLHGSQGQPMRWMKCEEACGMDRLLCVGKPDALLQDMLLAWQSTVTEHILFRSIGLLHPLHPDTPNLIDF